MLKLKQAPAIQMPKYVKRSSEEYSNFIDTLHIVKKDIPVILNGEFFQIVELDGRKVKAICMKCTNTQVLSAVIEATSNLLRHMKVSLLNI